MKAILFSTFAIPLFFVSPLALGANENVHSLVQKVVVFPISTSQAYVKKADDTWWKMREKLADGRRFLVAKKSFMQQKDVFQPRENLTAPDAILLGKLLDADALVVTELQERKIIFRAFSGRDGFLLWNKELHLHPSLPIDKQLEPATIDLIDQFVASFPYQGHQIIDPLIGKAIYEEGDIRLAKVEVSENLQVKPGDNVNWIQVHRQSNKPLFINGGQVSVIAEGEVVSKDRGVLTVKLNRSKDLNELHKDALIAIPQESQRLQALLDDSTKLSVDVVRTPLKDMTQKGEDRPLLSALAGIANIALLLLLAF
jgi:hypothetical protein